MSKYTNIVNMIITRMRKDHIILFINLKRDPSVPHEVKDDINNLINLLYSLQVLTQEIIFKIIENF